MARDLRVAMHKRRVGAREKQAPAPTSEQQPYVLEHGAAALRFAKVEGPKRVLRNGREPLRVGHPTVTGTRTISVKNGHTWLVPTRSHVWPIDPKKRGSGGVYVLSPDRVLHILTVKKGKVQEIEFPPYLLESVKQKLGLT